MGQFTELKAADGQMIPAYVAQPAGQPEQQAPGPHRHLGEYHPDHPPVVAGDLPEFVVRAAVGSLGLVHGPCPGGSEPLHCGRGLPNLTSRDRKGAVNAAEA